MRYNADDWTRSARVGDRGRVKLPGLTGHDVSLFFLVPSHFLLLGPVFSLTPGKPSPFPSRRLRPRHDAPHLRTACVSASAAAVCHRRGGKRVRPFLRRGLLGAPPHVTGAWRWPPQALLASRALK